jgi:hypothetical protein
MLGGMICTAVPSHSEQDGRPLIGSCWVMCEEMTEKLLFWIEGRSVYLINPIRSLRTLGPCA